LTYLHVGRRLLSGSRQQRAGSSTAALLSDRAPSRRAGGHCARRRSATFSSAGLSLYSFLAYC